MYLDTLAESGTQNHTIQPSKVFVSGQGTDIIDNPSLEGKAKRKAISRKVILSLIDVATEKGEPERVKAYWNTYHCLRNVVISDGRLHGNYCKNRFCTVCNAIRKAELINKYYPVLSTWDDIHFVTLSVKAVKAQSLKKWINGMVLAFDRIKNRCKKRHQRGKGIKLIGIKSLECNFNATRRWYNPHFHIIVPTKEVADLLKKEWMKQWRPKNKSIYRYKYTSPKAQDIQQIYDLEKGLIEVIKYGSKIFSEPNPNKKNKKRNPHNLFIYANALDNILTAMKDKRIFDRFGFNLPKKEPKEPQVKLVDDYERWLFSASASDWVNPKTGECLTGYTQSKELNYLLNECINTELY